MGLTVTRWSTFADAATASTEWSHSGIAVLDDGTAVFSSPGSGRLLVADPQDRDTDPAPRVIDVPMNVGHGILHAGDAVLVADPGTGAGDGQVLRVDLSSGASARTVTPPSDIQAEWRPTSVAVDPAGRVWVADGYGTSRVFVFDLDGSLALSIDAADAARPFDCPHGIALDPRGPSPLMVVADRVNRRLVWLCLDGAVERVLEHDLFSYPSSLAIRGDDLLVTDLHGALLQVDAADAVSAIVPFPPGGSGIRDDAWPNVLIDRELARPPLSEGVLRSPHGIAIGRDGAVLLTEWCLGGRQVRLELSEGSAPGRSASGTSAARE